jgi:hypothetical protein
VLQDFNESRLTLLYLLWPTSSGIVNLVAKIYSNQINKKLKLTLMVSHNQEDHRFSEEKVILSLTSVLVIPLIITTGFLSSFSNREVRLHLLFPIQLTLLGVLLPLLLIGINPKMKNKVVLNYFEPYTNKLKILFKNFKKIFSKKVYPINT